MLSLSRKLGIHIPLILLPNKAIDLKKWSVVACDQYTSQLDYWKQLESNIGQNPSTLNLIYPEVYLEEDNCSERIDKINKTMTEYINKNVLEKQAPGFIYVDRKTSHAQSRKGLIIAVDLEKYDYNKGSQTLIRATEGTVLDRLPPRIRIRENAPIELPHIMLLIDDPDMTVIEPLSNNSSKLELLYDFDLMMDSGHIKGYKVESPEHITSILEALEKLSCPDEFRAKYNVGEEKGVLLFAAGDGNHSLASAKGHWENVKKTLDRDESENHPSRYALVEIVNVHDIGLTFEPIHRVVFNIDSFDLLNNMVVFLGDCNGSFKMFNSKEEMQAEILILQKTANSHIQPFITSKGFGIMTVLNPKCNLAVGTLQAFLDEYLAKNTNAKTDYIHGADVVSSLGSLDGNIGFYLPPMDKNDLFKTVILDGVLPRKTFSMGEADEKRFYLECRNIR
jgi:uncharacterized protein (DUF1015 family)